MNYTEQINEMCKVKNLKTHGPSPLPMEGKWIKAKDLNQISGLSHGVGGCAPQQGACKLTLNVKDGIIQEALVETIGCSGMTHSAAMAGEILPGKTLLEAVNTDLVCDAINVAMRELFLQLMYGRSQSAFSDGGLPVGSCVDDLGKNKQSKVATIYSSNPKGVRYLNTVEGYITKLALDNNSEVIGYEYIVTPVLIKMLNQGKFSEEALKLATKTYGRFNEAVKVIDPREE